MKAQIDDVCYAVKQAVSLDAPFPWFGGKRKVATEVWRRLGRVDNYVAWISQRQFFGCRPQSFVALLVDQRSFLRALANEAIALAREAGRWIARCAAFVVRQRLGTYTLDSAGRFETYLVGPLGGNYIMSFSALQAPFPWFGGKRKVAKEVWTRFGAIQNFR